MSLFTGIERAIDRNTVQLKRIADFLQTSIDPEIPNELGDQLTAAKDTLANSSASLGDAVDFNTLK